MTKNITNLDEEENPLKCHWSELWNNKTNQMAIYAAHWRPWQNLDVVTLKVNNVYKTIAIEIPTIQDDPEGEGSTFTCGIANECDFCQIMVPTNDSTIIPIDTRGTLYRATRQSVMELDNYRETITFRSTSLEISNCTKFSIATTMANIKRVISEN